VSHPKCQVKEYKKANILEQNELDAHQYLTRKTKYKDGKAQSRCTQHHTTNTAIHAVLKLELILKKTINIDCAKEGV